MIHSIHHPEVIGIDGVDITASKKGLRITVVIPSWQGGVSPEEVTYWQDQIFIWDESRKMLKDLKDLTRVLRKLPTEAQTEDIRALLEHMKDFDTEVVS